MTETAPRPDRLATLDVPVWDLETLRARCLGNEALMARVIERFLDTLSGEIEQLVATGNTHEAASLARHAHRFRGTTANLGARQLESLCAAIEQSALQGEWPGWTERTTELHRCASQLAVALRAFRATASHP